jgi:hypothetical protein
MVLLHPQLVFRDRIISKDIRPLQLPDYYLWGILKVQFTKTVLTLSLN